jgi:hypothetical protein
MLERAPRAFPVSLQPVRPSVASSGRNKPVWRRNPKSICIPVSEPWPFGIARKRRRVRKGVSFQSFVCDRPRQLGRHRRACRYYSIRSKRLSGFLEKNARNRAPCPSYLRFSHPRTLIVNGLACYGIESPLDRRGFHRGPEFAGSSAGLEVAVHNADKAKAGAARNRRDNLSLTGRGHGRGDLPLVNASQTGAVADETGGGLFASASRAGRLSPSST